MSNGGVITNFIIELHRSKAEKVARKISTGDPIFIPREIKAMAGKLTLSDAVIVNGLTKYNCTCTCGNSISLDYSQLMYRNKRGSGCLLPECTFSTGKDLILTDMNSCFKDQFKRMLAYYPEEVCSDWGGLNILDLPSAYENFYSYVQDMGADPSVQKWHIRRIKDNDKFCPGNIELSTSDRLEGTAGVGIFSYENNVLNLKEATEILGCTEEDILNLQEAMISDEDIYESLA